MFKKSLAIAISSIIISGCSNLDDLTNQQPQKVTDPELRTKDPINFLWGKNKDKSIIFKIKDKELIPIRVTAKPSNIKSDEYCLNLSNIPCGSESNNKLFQKREDREPSKIFEGIVMTPLALIFDTVTLSPITNGNSAVIQSLAGSLEDDRKSIVKVNKLLSSQILSEYAKIRHSPKELLNFAETFKLEPESPIILKDLATAYNHSNNEYQARFEKLLVKPYLVKYNSKLVAGEAKDIGGSSLLFSVDMSGKDYTQYVNVYLDQNSGIPIKHHTYKVKIKSKLDLKYDQPIKGEGKDFREEETVVLLTPKNNYQATATFSFPDIATAGFYKPMGLGLVTSMAKILGSKTDTTEVEKGFPFKLNNIETKIEVIGFEAQ